MNKNSPTKIKYLTNKDLLEEIHLSKSTYCEFIDSKYSNYDIIVDNLSKVTQELLNDVRKRKVAQEIIRQKKELISKGIKNPVINFTLDDVPQESIVIRLMTFDHIPINDDRVHKAKTEAEKHYKCNFPPFQHFIIRDGEFCCVGKSHWQGGLENGWFNTEHGKMTNRLALMFMKLVERYGHRGNWRGYCITRTDEILTQRGWLNMDEINENDIILSYDQGNLKWSTIKSIYRGQYDGLMHKITNNVTDMLVTPNHKLMTERGLIPIELLVESDKIILMGNAVDSDNDEKYSDDIVELAGWIVTEGNYERHPTTKELKRICIWQNPGPKADRIRNCLNNLGYKFSESLRLNNLCFGISRKHSKEFQKILPIKNLTMDFILSLTNNQRELLIDTMVDGDGHRVGNSRKYGQKSKEGIDLFQALCTISGYRTTTKLCRDMSYGQLRDFYRVSLLSNIKNKTQVKHLNFNGGKRNGTGLKNKDKITHPNVPTTPYNGMVWCPETEYGCFIVRRNGKVYLTGNTYLDEMKNQALLQLSQIGLQFDESRSVHPNPFSYYTQCLANSFTRVLNIEKKNQNIRDDLLTMHGANPSYTRINENEIAAKQINSQSSKPTVD